MTTEVFQYEFDHLKEVFQDESCEDPMTDWDILLYMVDKADSGDYPKHLTIILRKKAISRGWYIPISKEECDRTQTFPKKRKVYDFVLGGIRYVWDGPNSLETENEYVERLKSESQSQKLSPSIGDQSHDQDQDQANNNERTHPHQNHIS